MVSSMLEAEFPLECDTDDFRLWLGVIVTGEFNNDVPREKAVKPGDRCELQVTGSVTLRCMDGREVV